MQLTRDNQLFSQRTGTQLFSSSPLQSQTKFLRQLAVVCWFNILTHTLVCYMDESLQSMKKTTHKPSHMIPTFKIMILALYLQTRTEFCTKVYLIPVEIYFKYSYLSTLYHCHPDENNIISLFFWHCTHSDSFSLSLLAKTKDLNISFTCTHA